jgi:O-acetyl-ADP-ribose deacetylase (regulator of RNase III)
MTAGYRLPARFVIHTVGPVWNGGTKNEEALLADCYRNSLRLAGENGVKTVAFPAISCGVYRFPVSRAAEIALETTRHFLSADTSIEQVLFVCRESGVLLAYRTAFEQFTHP